MKIKLPIFLIVLFSIYSCDNSQGKREAENIYDSLKISKTENPYFFKNIIASRSELQDFYRDYAGSIDLTEKSKILEFGSGAGSLSIFMAERIKNETKTLTCLDIERVAIDVCKERLKKFKNIIYLKQNVVESDLNENYDIIIVHYVIHQNAKEQRELIWKRLINHLNNKGIIYIKDPELVLYTEIKDIMNKYSMIEISKKDVNHKVMGQAFELIFRKE